MKRIFGVIGLLVVIVFVGYLAVLPVQADAAPPPPPEGMNIEPGEEYTMVQMVSEEVLIDVGLTTAAESGGDSQFGHLVSFNCTFWMVNQGNEAEHLLVRFPIHTPEEIGTISIQSIKVDGKPIEWVEDEFDQDTMLDEFAWAHFDINFPVGEEVEIKITYLTFSYYSRMSRREDLHYILETGAGWYGPIGQGRIILRLPYAATSTNIDLAVSAPGAVFTDADVYWEFFDLEPTGQDNWDVYFVPSEIWMEVVAARLKLESSPNNTSALYRLASAAFSVCVEDRGYSLSNFLELYELGVSAIEHAVTLVPDSIEFHEMYALLLGAKLNPDRYVLLEEEVTFLNEVNPEGEAVSIASWKLREYSGWLTATVEAQASSTTTPSETPKPTDTQTSPTETPLPPTSTTIPRRATHTPEPTMGTDSQPEDNGRMGYYIAVGLLAALMALNRYLSWRDKRKK